ncbi:MAG: hypothetical protein R2828_21300 [Saprospiraceae bacterium]
MNREEFETICKKLNDICEKSEYEYKESKREIVKLFDQLESHRIEKENELQMLIKLHRNLGEIKNRKASYIEDEIGRRILVDLPFSIRMQDEEIPEDEIEVLKENYCQDQRAAIKMSSKLLKYGKEIVWSKEDKSKRYKNRIKEAIRMLNELQQFYKIKGVKEIFKSRIEDKDEDLQFFALYGLEIYYAHESAEELTKEEEKKLEQIIHSTKTRETASTCCQILINSGKIDEFGALMRIDDWKDRNWK